VTATLDAALQRYDQDETVRARVRALYVADRHRFVAAMFDMALNEGCNRWEAAKFANAVSRRVNQAPEKAGEKR
jgi:hypothetical protein